VPGIAAAPRIVNLGAGHMSGVLLPATPRS
jgi:hypothetical protein